jgi:integrase
MAKLALRHVHTFRDRHGRMRHYFRRGKAKAIPLPGIPGSEEFMAAYQTALGAAPPVPAPLDIGASRTQPGTIDALVVAYYRSSDWTSLEPETQKTRRRYIEGFRVQNGRKQVATLTASAIQAMMAAIDNVYTRRHWFKAIRGLLKSAVPTMLKVDPTDGITAPKLPKTKGHHMWTDVEIEQYRAYWKIGTPQRLVFEFALEAVSRRCEVVRLGPQHIRDGWIRIERAHGSADVEIPLTPELQAACEAMPRGHLTYLISRTGTPRSPAALGNDFRKWATEAGLPARCRLHGLKKGGMRRLAEAGNTTHELMGISGHKTLAMVQLYTDGADQKKLAASGIKKKIGGQSENTNVANPKVPRSQT